MVLGPFKRGYERLGIVKFAEHQPGESDEAAEEFRRVREWPGKLGKSRIKLV